MVATLTAIGCTKQAQRADTPDARYPVFYPITGGTGTTVTVAGDITATLPSPEEEDVYYFLIPPAGVDWTTGRLDLTPPGRTSRYLAFQYLYIPPVVGVWIEDEVVGAQPGTNLSGMHYAWNRFYQPETGRTIASSLDSVGKPTSETAPVKPRMPRIGPKSDPLAEGHDRPIGGIRMWWPPDTCDCDPEIHLIDRNDNPRWKEGVTQAIHRRVGYIRFSKDYGLQVHDMGNKPVGSELGVWILRNSGMPEIRGHMRAFAIIVVYPCPPKCRFGGYEQWRKEADWVPDNHVANDPGSNEVRMSSERPDPKLPGYCYRAWVDSPGVHTKQPGTPVPQSFTWNLSGQAWAIGLQGDCNGKEYRTNKISWQVHSDLRADPNDGTISPTGYVARTG